MKKLLGTMKKVSVKYNPVLEGSMLSYRFETEMTPEVVRLYEESFNEIEKIPVENINRTLKDSGLIVSYFDGEVFVGFTTVYVEEENAIMIYFATDSDCRSKGYGSQIISILRDILKGKNVAFFIEPLDPSAEDYDTRARRHDFYIRNGCIDSGFDIISDDAPFSAMFISGNLKKKDLQDIILRYETLHNGI